MPDEVVALRSQLMGIELLEPFVNTHDAIRVRCLTCNYESRRKLDWTRTTTVRCVQCGHRPYDFTKPSVIYLLHHDELRAFKIGVHNVGTPRIKEHSRNGWELTNRLNTTGESAYLVEQAILDWWRIELALPPYLSKSEMPQGGWTETVSDADIDARAIWATVKTLHRQFQGGARDD